MPDQESSSDGARVSAVEAPSLSALLTLAIAVTVVAALYLARDLLVPITLAVLLSFVLAPLVGFLRRARLPRAPAAVAALLLALAVILAMGGVIGAQIATLAQDLPSYRTTIRQKVDTVRSVTIDRLTGLLERIDELRSGAARPIAAARARLSRPRCPPSWRPLRTPERPETAERLRPLRARHSSLSKSSSFPC